MATTATGRGEILSSACQGRADLIPNPINVSGFKAEIDQANWILTMVTHSLNDQGFGSQNRCPR